MPATEQVILVDENDHPLGIAEKLDAHRKGLCHRAFSVFLFRSGPEMEVLLQQRAEGKYHCPNLWTNTCCSHPRPGEDIISAASRRLREELGIEAALKEVGQFHYIAHFENGLTENEVDHVLVGWVEDLEVLANPAEVRDYRWVTITDLESELEKSPETFTPWLREALGVATLRS